MLWVSLGVAALVVVAATELFIRYARRNGHDHPRLQRGLVRIPAVIIGAGSGLLFVNPANGVMSLALAIPLTALTLFWYRKFPCPNCSGALMLLRRAPKYHAPHYRCGQCGRRFHTTERILVENAPGDT